MGEPTNGGAAPAEAAAELSAKAPVKYPQGPMDAISAGAWLDLKVRFAAQIMGGAAAAEVVKRFVAEIPASAKLDKAEVAMAAQVAAEFALEASKHLIALAEQQGLVVPLSDQDGGAWLFAVHQRGAAMLGAFDAEMRVGAQRYAEMMQAAVAEAMRAAGPRVAVPNRPAGKIVHTR